MLNSPIETLKEYVNQPSGSLDKEDVQAVSQLIEDDFSSLGFSCVRHPGKKCGPTLEFHIGEGEKTLLLMGHMDTVFPHAVSVPFTKIEDDKALGSGITDMKGGVMIMLYALKKALSQINLKKYSLLAVINPDEEIGSPESHGVILDAAKKSFAALSFEPGGEKGRLTCARKGVTSVLLSCKGVPGHAGAQYKTCASAIQALCAQITKLYALRDDEKDISFNAGLIQGGTAENVVAPDAFCKCEFRYFDQSLQQPLMNKIKEICAQEPVKNVTTTVVFGASHPAVDLNEKSQTLLSAALQIAKEQGRVLVHERTGGAGDISIAALAGIGVLDGLGMQGGGMHTKDEYAHLSLIPEQIDLAAGLMVKLLQ